MERKEFKDDNYIHVPGFAITQLGLSGNELLCYSMIHGFSQDGQTKFEGSLSYIASGLNVTKANAKRIIDRLLEKQLIIKYQPQNNGGDVCRYTINTGIKTIPQPVSKRYRNRNQNDTATGIETIPNNNITNNESIGTNNQPAEGGLFDGQPEFEPITVTRPRRTSENLCIFENSKYADYKLFAAEFNSPEFNGVDIVYYYHVVSDWSASKGAKKRDWIATARNFMRKDMESGKLHKLNNPGGIDPDAMEYLKMMSE